MRNYVYSQLDSSLKPIAVEFLAILYHYFHVWVMFCGISCAFFLDLFMASPGRLAKPHVQVCSQSCVKVENRFVCVYDSTWQPRRQAAGHLPPTSDWQTFPAIASGALETLQELTSLFCYELHGRFRRQWIRQARSKC